MILKARSIKHQAPTGPRLGFRASDLELSAKRGYTLIELIVAIGLFAIIMTLATGAYLVMIGANRQTQGLATGINNLSFVLDSMTTAMRTGTAYSSAVGNAFTFKDQRECTVTYALSGSTIVESKSGSGCQVLSNVPLTEPAVSVTNLSFRPVGTTPGDTLQPYVTIYVSGTVTVAPGKTQSFAVESSVVMRGTDI